MLIGTTLQTPRLIIRHWQDTEADRRFFHRVNCEEAIMRFFPQRRTRDEADALFDRMQGWTAKNGFGWALALDRHSGAPLGFTGIALASDAAAIGYGEEIGWRYVPEAWGKGLATEGAHALLTHGFKDMGLPVICAIAVHNNDASLAVMRRLGMVERPDRAFDHPAIPAERPDLKRHRYFETSRADYLNKNA